MTVSPGGGSVGAAVVNFEAGPLLAECVDSLLADGVRGVVVVDNGFADGSVDALAPLDPRVTVVRPGRNVGYGSAANRGVAMLDDELVLVCNPDLRAVPGMVSALAEVAGTEPRAAVVGPVVRDPDGTRYPSARRFPSLLDAAGHAVLGRFRPDNPFTRRYHGASAAGAELWPGSGPVPADWVSGACMLLRRTAFEEVGGFDEGYFMYAEDVDLCWRLRQAGWSVMWTPAGEVVHVQGASTSRRPWRMLVEHHRSLFRFATRTSSGWRRLALPAVAAGLTVRLILAAADVVVRGVPGGGAPGARVSPDHGS